MTPSSTRAPAPIRAPLPPTPDALRGERPPHWLLHLATYAFAGTAIWVNLVRVPALYVRCSLAVLAAGAIVGLIFRHNPRWLRLAGNGAAAMVLAAAVVFYRRRGVALMDVIEWGMLGLLLAQGLSACRPGHYSVMGLISLVLICDAFWRTGGIQPEHIVWPGLIAGTLFLAVLGGSAPPRTRDSGKPCIVPWWSLCGRAIVILLVAGFAGKWVWAQLPTLENREADREPIWKTYVRFVLGVDRNKGSRYASRGMGATPNNEPDFMRRFYADASALDLDHTDPSRLTDRLLIAVRSQNAVYLRGIVLDQYTGRGWQPSAHLTFRPLNYGGSSTQGVVAVPDRPKEGDIDRGRCLVRIQARLGATIYLPAGATSLLEAGPLLCDQFGNLYATHPLSAGREYEVVTVQVRPAQYAAAGLTGDSETIRTTYLQLPPMPDRLVDACRKAVAGETSRLGAVMKLQHLVREGKQYSLAPTGLRPGVDAADCFVFEMKSGACTHFATALTVCCRIAGIPARLVTGFSPGRYNPATGFYEIAEKDSHAWTQVWFPETGWVDFDATPAGFEPDVLRVEAPPSESLWHAGGRWLASARTLGLRLAGRARAAGSWAVAHRVWAAYGLAGGVAAALVLIVCVHAARRLRWSLRWVSTRRAASPKALEEAYRCCLEWMRRRDLPVSPTMTPSEIVSALRRQGYPWAEEFARITDETQRLLFGGLEPVPDAMVRVRRDMAALRPRLAEKAPPPAAPT